MTNSATLVDTINCQFGNVQGVYEYECNIDTINTILDIRSASQPNMRIFVVGLMIAVADAVNLTFQSVNTSTSVVSKNQTFQLAANQGLPGLMQAGFYFATRPGEKLSIQASATLLASVGKSFILRVAESDAFRTA
jgi:hypothetical protein